MIQHYSLVGNFCSRNEKGNLCYDTVSGLLENEEAEVINACEDAITIFCSASRMKELEKSNKRHGLPFVHVCCLGQQSERKG